MSTTIDRLKLTPSKTNKLITACTLSFTAYGTSKKGAMQTFCIEIFEVDKKKSKKEKALINPFVFLRSGKNALRKITFDRKIVKEGTKVSKKFEILVVGDVPAKVIVIELKLPGSDKILGSRTLLYTKSK